MKDPFDGYSEQSPKNAEALPTFPKLVDRFESYGQATASQPESNISSSPAQDSVIQQEEKKEADRAVASQPEGISLDSLLTQMNDMTGLHRVKSEINQLLHFVKIQGLRAQEGISSTKPSLHTVFFGSPGTGKSTVARLYGQMLNAIGLLSKGHLVETDRSGLVGGYIGQTAIKTDEKIQEAMGGVLFIDEAYSLSKGENSQWDYGSEAIEILLKRMEDHRDNFVVIVAGYPKPMEEFLASNEGLRSRFSSYINFDDYSPQELLEIFRDLAQKENYVLNRDAFELVYAAIRNSHALRDKSFGNARYVRNLFETIIKNQASRIGITIQKPSHEQLCEILAVDVPFVTSSSPGPISYNKSK